MVEEANFLSVVAFLQTSTNLQVVEVFEAGAGAEAVGMSENSKQTYWCPIGKPHFQR